MSEVHQAHNQPNKVKVYAAAIAIYLLVSFAVETGITLLENATQQLLYPVFPFTRLGLLIITLLAANYYTRYKSGKPKPKLWWRILRLILLIIVAYGLIMAAWLSVLQEDLDRARVERGNTILELPQAKPAEINHPDFGE